MANYIAVSRSQYGKEQRAVHDRIFGKEQRSAAVHGYMAKNKEIVHSGKF